MKHKKEDKKMNKIHNNLNIENLIKTEWFNQFDEAQQNEILKGFLSKVDILKYAKTEFDWIQMAEIREGLEKNLDVSIYAKEDFSGWEMEEIKLGLETNLDVSIFAKKEYSWDR